MDYNFLLISPLAQGIFKKNFETEDNWCKMWCTFSMYWFIFFYSQMLFWLMVVYLVLTNAQRRQKKSCRDTCYPIRVKCMSKCKKGFWRNLSKPKFLMCSEKCDLGAFMCYPRCDCVALTEREKAGCDKTCDSFPFRSSFDRSHCHKECKFDYEDAQKSCTGRHQIQRAANTKNGQQKTWVRICANRL